MSPNNQATAIQLALRGVARELALSIPPQRIQVGAQINGIPTDSVTYIIYVLGNGYENTEDERTVTDGSVLFEFEVHSG